MGKKTLEEIGKILLVSMISILISVTSVRRKLLDEKMGRDEYEKDQDKRWEAHDKIQSKNDARNEETFRMVKFLYEQEIKKAN
jgi:hypothetical protein